MSRAITQTMLGLEEYRAILSCFGIPQSERIFSNTKCFLHLASSRFDRNLQPLTAENPISSMSYFEREQVY